MLKALLKSGLKFRPGIRPLVAASLALVLGWGGATAFAAVFPEATLPFAATAHAEVNMSKNQDAMRSKSKDLNTKARTRTKSATDRMHRILKERRDGKNGFPSDFNTVPGDKKR